MEQGCARESGDKLPRLAPFPNRRHRSDQAAAWRIQARVPANPEQRMTRGTKIFQFVLAALIGAGVALALLWAT